MIRRRCLYPGDTAVSCLCTEFNSIDIRFYNDSLNERDNKVQTILLKHRIHYIKRDKQNLNTFKKNLSKNLLKFQYALATMAAKFTHALERNNFEPLCHFIPQKNSEI